ncbi:hypothetical protein [Parashewanella tropica]|uniref:hypothetical protein n=1 Tax=Parashewanella tropica TaxID=2547970 RepID=UPI00105937C1|nr:hypothetical protein [Parashewanella tropica]
MIVSRITYIAAMFVIVACHGDNKENQNHVEIQKSQVNSVESLNKSQPILSFDSYKFNGSVFKLQGSELKAGSVVFDSMIGEHGVVKGSIVFVTNKTVVQELFLDNKVTLLANNTWEYYPNPSINIWREYKRIKAHSGVNTVEITIDYSPIKSNHSM